MTTYVVQGIVYFLTHPSLWLITLCPLLMTIVVAFATVISLFTAGLYPMAKLYEHAGIPSGWAWLLAVISIIAIIFLVTLIYSLTCTPCFVDKIFEKVLEMRGHKRVIEEAEVRAHCGRQCRACCNVSIWLRIVVLIVTIPLNLIPIVGTIGYVTLNASLKGWEGHLYYFEMKGYTYEQQKSIFDKRRLQYTSFGIQTMYLEMVPFLGFFFLFTNSVAAALFAADLEDSLLGQDTLDVPSEEYTKKTQDMV